MSERLPAPAAAAILHRCPADTGCWWPFTWPFARARPSASVLQPWGSLHQLHRVEDRPSASLVGACPSGLGQLSVQLFCARTAWPWGPVPPAPPWDLQVWIQEDAPLTRHHHAKQTKVSAVFFPSPSTVQSINSVKIHAESSCTFVLFFFCGKPGWLLSGVCLLP